MSAYKEAKEAFVAGGEGSSVYNINVVCSTALTTYALWRIIAGASIEGSLGLWRSPILEYIVLVVPLLLVTTVLSSHAVLVNAFILCLVIIAYPREGRVKTKAPNRPVVVPPPSPFTPGTPLSTASSFSRPMSPGPALSRRASLEPPSPSHDVSIMDQIDHTHKSNRPTPTLAALPAHPARLFKKPFVTVYRAHMMLITVLCILAVDFPAFPRKFGKTETWGTSLMDVGVGAFVFSLGIISAIPVLRTRQIPSLSSEVRRALRASMTILALGLARVVLVKGVDYPEHVTEYGVHWNFFMTLGVLPLVGAFCHQGFRYMSFSTMGFLVTVVHQLFLSKGGLQEWALNAPRTSIFSANKEGLTSLPGYIAIFLLEKAVPKPGKTATVLASWCMVWWTAYAASRWIVPVSRCMANMTYTLWSVATNVSLLLGFLVISDRKVSGRSDAVQTPAILEAMNQNSLAVFLVANLFTGVINMSVETMYASDKYALVVMLSYSAVVTIFAWSVRNIRLKL